MTSATTPPSSPPSPSPSPQRTFALIVGIERYAAGPAWDLPGPVNDALRFRAWLLRGGVPEQNILLCLDPLADPGVAHRPADHATLRGLLLSRLPALDGELLWVWWGGHGVLDQTERLRLFCADAAAADKRNLDLESMRTTLASDMLPGFGRQVWIVDACQTFEEEYGFRTSLPAEQLPTGRRLRTHHQTLLLAATRGQRAANDPGRGTGLFSESVLDVLEASPPGQPSSDPEALFREVRERVERLRAGRRTEQEPELRLYTPERTEHIPPSPGGGSPSRPALPHLVDTLLTYPMMSDPAERQLCVSSLPTPRVARIPRHPKARADVIAVIKTLAEQPSEVWLLYDAVTLLDDDAGRARELEAALGAYAGARPQTAG
ncbi:MULTISPECIES: caspase family protein [unclassified Streptomyces]|uniref:effector-associated domain 2-containing protein n=1 Tax=unclassified Streptomyces TaxID=2593676 RepID=UPI002259BCAB|nr:MULTISPECIES: caspase family protein [unclassified Streptomyces]MCX4528797.1 caspase family protein [Streptomyces sp. NBC_01551]MCX4540595.1 caspase family protein [Streptomyces sp. NBC_01565]